MDKSPAGNLRMLADVYHLATMGEDLRDTLSRYADRIGHVQVADVPGRGAPGTGTLDFEAVFAHLAGQGYAGLVGLEYLPGDPGDSTASLAWR
jgi:hydroxypyruvate isomerase